MKRSPRLNLALLLAALALLGPAAGLAQTAPPTPPAAAAPVTPAPVSAAPGATVAPQPIAPRPPSIPGFLTAGAPIRLTATIDRCVIRVGDLIHYAMTIEAPPGSKIMMPQPGAQLGGFLIRDYKLPGLEPDKETVTLSDRLWNWFSETTGIYAPKAGEEKGPALQFTITAYETGDLVIPPLPVVVVDPQGREHQLAVESARIRVVPVTNPEDLTIRDVKAPVAAPVPLKTLLPYVLAPLAIVAAVIALIWLRRRRRVQAAEVIALRPAHEIALEELAALEQEGLLQAGAYEKYYTRLSWIIRKYLALRFTFYALEYTTAEIIIHLTTADLEHGDYERVRRFLEAADQVKFARHEPAIAERNAILGEAREIVERLKPLPPPEESQEAA